jgi:hypothetical protein
LADSEAGRQVNNYHPFLFSPSISSTLSWQCDVTRPRTRTPKLQFAYKIRSRTRLRREETILNRESFTYIHRHFLNSKCSDFFGRFNEFWNGEQSVICTYLPEWPDWASFRPCGDYLLW